MDHGGNDDDDGITDITVVILRQIRDEIVATRQELTETREQLSARIDANTAELRSFKVETRDNFAKVHGRMDHMVAFMGTHHTDLAARVEKIEKHLKL